MSVVGLKIKGLHFKSAKVMKSVDGATRKVLSKMGAFIRQTAKNSIKKPTGSRNKSILGQPPISRSGLLKDLIFFGYDPNRRSVVIGPAIIERIARKQSRPGPGVLEDGGVLTQRRAISQRKNRRRRKVLQRQETVTFSVKPRPFMGPAMDKELPKMPAMWRDSVR